MCDFMENKKAVAVENAAEDTIDLLEIFRALYRRWVWIVFVALVFGIALGMYGKFVVKDVFQAEASMCIIDSNKEVSMSDLQVGSALTNDYEGIIKSRVVLTKVISNLNLDIAYKNLYNAVSVDNPEATRIIRIRVVSGNKEEAVDIANEILSVSIEEIPHVLGSNTPTVLDKADEFFAENTRRSVVSYILIGLMAGIVVSCGRIHLLKMKKIFKNAAAFLYWAQFRIIKAERKGRKRLYGRMNCLFQWQRLFISLERQYFIAVKM